MSPTKAEKSLVQLFTIVCWWVDAKLGKSIFWCAMAINFLVIFLINIIIFFIFKPDIYTLYIITADTFISPVMLYLFVGARADTWGIIRNTKQSPNPNIYGAALSKARTNINIFFLATPFVFWYDNVFYLAVIFAMVTGFYVLCSEPSPPQKKKEQSKHPTQKLVLGQ